MNTWCRYVGLLTSTTHQARRGKTPVLQADEARTVLDSIDVETLVGLRDRALENAPASFSAAQLRVLLRAIVNLDPHTFADDLAEEMAEEKDDRNSEEVLLAALDATADAPAGRNSRHQPEAALENRSHKRAARRANEEQPPARGE